MKRKVSYLFFAFIFSLIMIIFVSCTNIEKNDSSNESQNEQTSGKTDDNEKNLEEGKWSPIIPFK